MLYYYYVPNKDDDSNMQQYVEAYILGYNGGTLFPDYLGRYVNMMLLSLLEDFAIDGTYS